MAITRYLGWILLPILVWSVGGAWIESEQRLLHLRICMHAECCVTCTICLLQLSVTCSCYRLQLSLVAQTCQQLRAPCIVTGLCICLGEL